MTMVHGDDKGLVLPPKVASIQVIVVPVGITVKTTPEERVTIFDASSALADTLKKGGVRAKADLRDNYTPGYKYNHWELRVKFGNFRVYQFDSKSVQKIWRRMRQELSGEIMVNIASFL